MAFVLLSFFTVYMEGFETVLFYQALFSFIKYGSVRPCRVNSGHDCNNHSCLDNSKTGRKLPLRVLFILTMGSGAFMSIIFLGNTIREFQELGWISTTPIYIT
jgi:high-affinity iron transporter